MKKAKKTAIISLSSILIAVSLIVILYYIYFYPKTHLNPIDNNVSYKSIDILKKFNIDDFSLSLKKESITSTITLNDKDLTDLIILALKQTPSLNNYITGINVNIENNCINLYCNLKYRSIPFSSKLIFTLTSENGKAILHYKKGQVGFIPIPNGFIFSKLKGNSVVQIDERNKNIILSLGHIKQLNISNATVKDNKIYITINGSLNFN